MYPIISLVYILLLHPPEKVPMHVQGYTVPDSLLLIADSQLLKHLGFMEEQGHIVYKATFERKDRPYELYIDCSNLSMWCKQGKITHQRHNSGQEIVKPKGFVSTKYTPEFISDEHISITTLTDLDFTEEDKNTKKKRFAEMCQYFVGVAVPFKYTKEDATDYYIINRWVIFWYRKENLPEYIQPIAKTAR